MTKKFLTKDNFWNLMFWVMMVIAGVILDNLPESLTFLGLPLLIGLPIGVVLIIKKQIGVTVAENNLFINSQGEKLDNRYPTLFWLVIVVSVLVCIPLLHATKDIALLRNSLGAYIGIILFLPTLYFIAINCPISVLFKGKTWTSEILGLKAEEGSSIHTYKFTESNRWDSPLSKFTRENTITDPSYRGYGCNIFNDWNRR